MTLSLYPKLKRRAIEDTIGSAKAVRSDPSYFVLQTSYFVIYLGLLSPSTFHFSLLTLFTTLTQEAMLSKLTFLGFCLRLAIMMMTEAVINISKL
jgi:hypothetical protein